MKKIAILAALLFLSFLATIAYAAPVSTIMRNILPETTDRYDLGTTTAEWNGVYTKSLNITGTCTG